MSLLDRITGFWDGAAEEFDEEADHGLRDPAVRAAWARLLAGWLPPPPCEVLDVGCGTGSLSLLAAEAGHRVVGVDLSPRMAERARSKLGGAATVLVGDAADPPVGDRLFDAVLVRHVVWTLPSPRDALRRWASLLRRPGRIVLVEGRWGDAAAADPAPYVEGTGDLPWQGGVPAAVLGGALAPLVDEVRTERLDDPVLWGRPISDERYVVIGTLDE